MGSEGAYVRNANGVSKRFPTKVAPPLFACPSTLRGCIYFVVTFVFLYKSRKQGLTVIYFTYSPQHKYGDFSFLLGTTCDDFQQALSFFLGFLSLCIKFIGIQDFWGLEVCNGFGGLRGALSPKIVSIFVHLVRISRYRAYVLRFFCKTLKNLTKSFKSYLPPFSS